MYSRYGKCWQSFTLTLSFCQVSQLAAIKFLSLKWWKCKDDVKCVDASIFLDRGEFRSRTKDVLTDPSKRSSHSRFTFKLAFAKSTSILFFLLAYPLFSFLFNPRYTFEFHRAAVVTTSITTLERVFTSLRIFQSEIVVEGKKFRDRVRNQPFPRQNSSRPTESRTTAF